jgi:hypothetical protein
MGTDNVYVVIDNITFKLSFFTFRLFMEDGINVLQSFLAERHKPNT